MSLFEGDQNAFYEEGAKYQLSKTGRHFIAGLLRHANEISAVTNQFVNSYKRLWGGDEAPSSSPGGMRTARPSSACRCTAEQEPVVARRVPRHRLRLEPVPRLRAAARGRTQGHRGGLRAAARGREQRVVPERRRAACTGIRGASCEPRPRSGVHGGIRTRRRDAGEQVFNYVLLNKRKEWEAYRGQVTPFELKSNLELL